jgi:hypothetical protein
VLSAGGAPLLEELGWLRFFQGVGPESPCARTGIFVKRRVVSAEERSEHRGESELPRESGITRESEVERESWKGERSLRGKKGSGHGEYPVDRQ